VKLDLAKSSDVEKFRLRGKVLIEKKAKVELKERRPKRSSLQNRALHLLFKQLSDNLNNLGMTFNYTGLKGVNIEIPHTGNLVKEVIWRPIQVALFDIKSTRDIETKHIDTILDVLTKFFAEKGIDIHFPSKFDLIVKELEKNGYL
jgi:hypothetical protein